MKKSISNLFYIFKKCYQFNSYSNYNSRSTSAFTIVELLVVIVVIGILAAITIVSYTGITNKANVASLSSDLDNAAKQLKLFQIDNSNYPTTIDCTIADSVTNKCLKVSNGATYEYYVVNTANNQNFCITATKGSYSYSINNNGSTIPTAYCPVLYLDASNSLSYPGAGNNKWYDLSGNNNNGTLNGGVGYDNTNGGSLTFNGSGEYVQMSDNSSLKPTRGITVSAWINWSENTNQWEWLVAKNSDSGASNGYMLYKNPGNSTIGFQIDGVMATIPETSFNIGSWYNLVGTATAGGSANLYVNGVLVSSVSGVPNPIVNYANSLGINKCFYYAGTTLFSGYISNVSIYNTALSVSGIQQNFNALKARYGL